MGDGVPHHLGLPRGGDGDDVDHLARGPQPLQQAEAVAVRQVHVEQHQVDLVLVEEPRGLAGGAGHARHLEPRHPAHVGHVRLGGELLVLDDEDTHVGHGTPAFVRSTTSNSAPPSV